MSTTPDYAGLIDRLEGIYRIPITDGLGAVGTGEEPDNPNEFVRKFETAPIQKEAAQTIRTLLESKAVLEARLEKWLGKHEQQFLRAEAAEAERDRLAERVAELEDLCNSLEAQAAELAAVKEMYAREGAKALYELERAERAEAKLAEAMKVIKPFALVAECDIGEDESDEDIFWPISNARYSMAGRLRVGHLRAARSLVKGGGR